MENQNIYWYLHFEGNIILLEYQRSGEGGTCSVSNAHHLLHRTACNPALPATHYHIQNLKWPQGDSKMVDEDQKGG